jgi:hypothetical protein
VVVEVVPLLLFVSALTTDVTDTFKPSINLLTRCVSELAASFEGLVGLPTDNVVGLETRSYDTPAIN